MNTSTRASFADASACHDSTALAVWRSRTTLYTCNIHDRLTGGDIMITVGAPDAFTAVKVVTKGKPHYKVTQVYQQACPWPSL
jgi:hypothetical protein